MRLRSSAPRPVRSRSRSTEWWRVSNPSSNLVSEAWNSKGGRLTAAPRLGSEVSEGFLDSGEVWKHPVQSGQLEDHPHLLIGGCQPQVALGAADQLDRRGDCFFQRRSAGDVEAPRWGEHRHSGIGLSAWDLEAHWWQAYSEMAEVGPY